MKTITINPQPLNKDSFSPFGEIIDSSGDCMIINEGYAKKYNNLIHIDSKENNGRTALHLYKAKKRTFPLHIYMLEKHPYFSQAFIPKHNSPFLIVVALKSEKPNINEIKAFITNGNQGVNYHRGVWHFPLISMNEGDEFIVIDREEDSKSACLQECIIYDIKDIKIIVKKE